MSTRLPSRDDVLGLLREAPSPLDFDRIADALHVPPTSHAGFARFLDNLALEGLLVADRDAHFTIPGKHRSAPVTFARVVPPPPKSKPVLHVAKPQQSPAKKKKSLPARLSKAERPAPEEMPGFTVAEARSVPPSAPKRTRERPTSPLPVDPDAYVAPPKRTEGASPTMKRAAGDEAEGYVSIAARGFGFVASALPGGEDLFVPKESLGGAMHGDRVLARVTGRSARGIEGEVVKIVTRAVKRVAGTLRRRGKSTWLEPDDTRVRGPIPLPREIDQKDNEGNSGTDGDAAVVSITRYPSFWDETPVGKLEAVLGRPGEIGVEVAKILVREQIEEVHPEGAVVEAEGYGLEVPRDMLAGRVDLTHLPLPTIDPEDARDHDDAVWVERKGDGYKAWIAIADVSSYVRPGTALDAEALVRGCSVYLPDRAIPMLPRALSSNLCSLLPDVVRLCLCAEVDIDAHGRVERTKLHRAFMKSQAKLSYGSVARALGLSEAPPSDPKAEELLPGLKIAFELSRVLRGVRMQRGAVDLDLPEAKIFLDEDGNPFDIKKRSQDAGVKKAYQLIEELMLLANECVARYLSAAGVPTIFRIHAPPDEEKLARFAQMCEALGVPFDLDDARDPRRLTALLKSLRDHPKAMVLEMLMLRSMKQATYDPVNIGHFGLASKAYLHFTSPIRRYPDLVVHRSVHTLALGGRVSSDERAREALAEAALVSSQRERKSMEVEREVADLYRAAFMRDRVGEKYAGIVTAVVGSGIYVALDDPFVDVLVKLEDLGADRYVVADDGLEVTGERSGDTVRLGDRLTVEIIDVALLRRTTYGRRLTGDVGLKVDEFTPRARAKTGKKPDPAKRGKKAEARAAARKTKDESRKAKLGAKRAKAVVAQVDGRRDKAPGKGKKKRFGSR